jgi:hypothetical protein
LNDCCKEVTVDQRDKDGDEIILFFIVPFNEVAVYLQGKQVEEEVSNVGMEKSTSQYPPHFVLAVEPREVLALKPVEGTVPGYLGLLLGVVVNDENDEHDDVYYSQNEGNRLHGEARKKYSEKRRGSLSQKLIWDCQTPLVQVACCLFVNSPYLIL